MGHEISYCGRCANRIGGVDLEKGKAYRISGKTVCANCLTPDEKHTIATSSATREKSTTRIKMTKPGPGTSTKLPAARPEPAAASSKTPLILGLSAGALALVGGAFFMMSDSKPPPTETATRPPDPVVAKPVLRTPEPPREEKPEDPQLREAREAVEAARAKSKSAPGDLEAQRAAWEEAARKAALTPLFKEASTELAAVREKLAALKPPEPVKPPEPPVKPPPPPEPPPPAEVAVSAALWNAAMAKASAGDYEGAAADLRKEPAGRNEADLVVQAGAAALSSRQEIRGMAAGQPIALRYRGEGGDRRRIEGTLVRAWAARLEIKAAEETVFVELGDICASSLVALCKPSAVLHRRFALLCILEGEADAARALVGADGFPARYWDYAREASSKVPRPPQRELDARRLFYQAERDFAKGETMSEAISKYRTLLDSYADTAVVKGEQVRVKTRAESGKDFLLTAFQLKGSPGYALQAYPRSEAAWTSKADVDGAQAVTNFVAAEFTAMPNVVYKAWALIGACCTDTFTFYLQTTEGTDVDPKTRKKESIEPGAAMASVVKHSLKELARSHRSHVVKVPKSPVRWEWISLPLPKYAAPGLKKIHLISDQQGFSVGAVVVSSTRTAPPADAELKEEAAKAKAAVAEQGFSIENPGEKAWKPLFDGKTEESVLRYDQPGWKVEDGKLVSTGVNDAGQTKEVFTDGEVRVRFEGSELNRLWFKFRQGGDAAGGFHISLESDFKSLEGKPHELIITGRADKVTATLDGKPVPVVMEGPATRGCLQFNGMGKRFAVLSLDFRP